MDRLPRTELSMTAAGDRAVRNRLEQALERAGDADRHGGRIFLRLFADEARAAADASDIRSRNGTRLGVLDGRLVSVSDHFDVAGYPTTAGSMAYADALPARRDAISVRFLRAAGAVLLGQTHIAEFGLSSLGTNKHSGSPANRFDPQRVPGGSCAGAAASVANGYCDIALGMDTDGSVQIPAALFGLVGFKPTRARLPRDGIGLNASAVACVGLMTRSVRDVADMDAILAGDEPSELKPRALSGVRIGVLGGRRFGDMDRGVRMAFEEEIERIRFEGAMLEVLDGDDLLEQCDAIHRLGSFPAIEAAWVHREAIANKPDVIDPVILKWVREASAIPAIAYLEMKRRRDSVARTARALIARYDALALPTVAIAPPRFDEVEDEADIAIAHAKLARNTGPFNLLDWPAMTTPIPDAGPLPAGLMLASHRGCDRLLMEIGCALECMHSKAL